MPTLDDVTAFQRELSGEGAVLGGAVTTFEGLTRAIAAAGGAPRPALTSSQRLLVISAAIAERRRGLGPMGRSAGYPGFARALTVLLDDLQAGGLSPDDVLAGARTLGDNAYLGDLAAIFSSYIEGRDRLGRTDSHGIAADAIAVLRGEAEDWPPRPVFLYGFDDLTPVQRDLVEALAARGEITITVPHEDGNNVLGARAGLLEALRGQGVEEEALEADAGNTGSATLFELERSFAGVREAHLAEGAEGLTLLRSAGARAEAEAIAAHVARLIHDGAKEEEIAIVLRDPARRGPLLARVLESYGVAAALEARRPVAATGVGGTLLALLESEYGARRAGDTLRWLRGPSGASPSAADWTERSIRQSRSRTAAEALELWSAHYEELPYDLRKLRDAPAEEIAAELADIARRMASRFLAGDEDGPAPGPGDGTELRAAAAIANALTEIAELGGLAPGPAGLLTFLKELDFLAWSGPIEGRVRIAEPRKLRATRFEHVVIGSLQDGEFPRRRGGDPFLSEPQRDELGLDPRSDVDAEERYLFYSSLSRASRSLTLSYRDSDEDGSAEARSPYLDDVMRLLCPQGDADERETAEKRLTRARDLARITLPAGDAPSEDELARALAALPAAAVPAALAAAAPEAATGARVEARVGAARVPQSGKRGSPGRSPTRPCSRSWAGSRPTAARRSRPSTPAPTSGSSTTSWTRSRSTRSPTPSCREASCTGCSTSFTRRGRAPTRGRGRRRSRPGSRGRESWCPSSPPSSGSASGLPSGLSGAASRASSSACSRKKRGAATALSSPGCWRPDSARERTGNGRRSRSTAGACTAPSIAPTAQRTDG